MYRSPWTACPERAKRVEGWTAGFLLLWATLASAAPASARPVSQASYGEASPKPQSGVGGQPGELIERTLAIVGGQVITLSDLQTTVALGLIEPASRADGVGPATSRLIDRLLVLREVQRYQPPEPGDAQVDQQMATIRGRFQNPDLFARTLEAGGFTEARLRAWIRDDLRIASYLGQRFAAVVTPTDEDVRKYFAEHREDFEKRQVSFEAAAPVIRERLSAERRAELIDDWVADLRRRTAIVELWKR